MTRPPARLVLAAVLVVSLAARLWLALRLAPGAGFAGDMNSFLDWAETFAGTGPTFFYAADPSANYPPVSILVLGGLQKLSVALAPAGVSADRMLLLLLKVPAVLADVITTGLVYLLGRDVVSRRVGLIAAVLFAVIPPIWYVSALWGQIDSIMIMFGVAALVLLVRRRPGLAMISAVGGLMVKPQGILILLIVLTVSVADIAADRARPKGRRALRIVGTVGVAAALGAGLLTAFNYRSLAPTPWPQIPVIGDVVGFLVQSATTGQLFPVLTANAYNGWALVGTPSLAWGMHTGTVRWLPDHGGLGLPPYALIGLIALALAVVIVLGGLLLRRDKLAVVFAATVLGWAFYAFPTRVHERYLLPVFAPGAVLAACGVVRTVGYLVAGLANLINLHAVLGAPLRVIYQRGSPSFGGAGSAGRPGPNPSPTQGARSVRAQDLSLPWVDQARSEQLVTLVAAFQTAAGVALVSGWVAFVIIGARRRRRSGA